MVVVSTLPHTEFGPNDYREDASYFIDNRSKPHYGSLALDFFFDE